MEKINFINGQSPALSATNLNQLQKNVEDEISILNESATEIESLKLSSNGYIRFKNGLQIAWVNGSFTTTSNIWAEPIYYSDHKLPNWEAPFQDVFVTVPMSNSTLYWSTIGETSVTSPGTVRCFRPTGGTANVYLGAIAVGKWK